MTSRIVFVLLSIFALPLAAQSELDSTMKSLRTDVRRVTLENGLRIIMVRRPFSPTVACYMKFKAGGADETEESAGIAHMLEHMLFKGTERVGTLDFEKEKKYIEQSNVWADRLDDARRALDAAEKSGDTTRIAEAKAEVQKRKQRLMSLQQMARKYMIPDEDSYIYAQAGERGYNAYTTKDLTNYQVELPANRLEIWAKLESDRMENSVLRDFYTEREVVREERRLRVDNVAQGALLEQFIKDIYGSHPYGRSLIGSMQVIQYLNFGQAKSFYNTYYAPNNTVIALVGDIDLAQTEALMRKYFSHLKRKDIPERPSVAVAPSRARTEIEKPGSPVMFLAWNKPSGMTKDSLSLEVLSSILAGRSDSRLVRKLVMKDRSAAEVSAFTGYPGERHPNLLTIQAVPAPGKSYDDVQKGVLEEIASVQKDGVTQDELDRVKASMVADFLYGLRSNAEYADNLSYYELLYGNYETLFTKITALSAIAPADVKKAAIEYMTPDKMHSARLKQAKGE
ncbi:MAG TPA: insulinase family protein, partial [Leptospiraceae bacterium]|nr:insulinase family protein [Leptospiraceae bacterium]